MTKRFSKYLKTFTLATAFFLTGCGSIDIAHAPGHSYPASPVSKRDGTNVTVSGMIETTTWGNTDDRAEVKAIIVQVANEHGIDPMHFLRMAEIESGFNPKAFHPKSRAAGLFQFIPSTAQSYGLIDCFDAHANAKAAATLWLDNAASLRKALGREPSAGELYLAHQQGIAGATKLLANPDTPAHEIVGRRAVTLNGGTLNMSARDFAHLWMKKFV